MSRLWLNTYTQISYTHYMSKLNSLSSLSQPAPALHTLICTNATQFIPLITQTEETRDPRFPPSSLPFTSSYQILSLQPKYIFNLSLFYVHCHCLNWWGSPNPPPPDFHRGLRLVSQTYSHSFLESWLHRTSKRIFEATANYDYLA